MRPRSGDLYRHRLPVFEIGHAHQGTESERAVRCGELLVVEDLAARGGLAVMGVTIKRSEPGLVKKGSVGESCCCAAGGGGAGAGGWGRLGGTTGKAGQHEQQRQAERGASGE